MVGLFIAYLLTGAAVTAILFAGGAEVEGGPKLVAVIFLIIAWPYVLYRIAKAMMFED